MTRRTRPADRKSDMLLVIGRIQRDAVPARREVHVRPDPAWTRRRREMRRIQHRIQTGTRVVALKIGARKAAETVLGNVALGAAQVGVSHEHAEARAESGDVLPAVLGKVVDGHAAVGAVEVPVGQLRHALVGPVTGAEVQVGRPVVGEVVAVAACRAVGYLGNVDAGFDGCVEGIAADDLVDVRGGGLAWGDETVCQRINLVSVKVHVFDGSWNGREKRGGIRIKSFDCDLGTTKSEESRGECPWHR